MCETLPSWALRALPCQSKMEQCSIYGSLSCTSCNQVKCFKLVHNALKHCVKNHYQYEHDLHQRCRCSGSRLVVQHHFRNKQTLQYTTAMGFSTHLADHCWHGACQGAGATHFSKVSSASCEKFMYKAVMPWYRARRRWMSLFSVKA